MAPIPVEISCPGIRTVQKPKDSRKQASQPALPESPRLAIPIPSESTLDLLRDIFYMRDHHLAASKSLPPMFQSDSEIHDKNEIWRKKLPRKVMTTAWSKTYGLSYGDLSKVTLPELALKYTLTKPALLRDVQQL